MAEKPLIGLVGCGRWGRYILRDLLSLGCSVAVADRSEKGRSTALEGGAATIVESPDLLPEADGYVVASSTITHGETIDVLLPRGAPIFCEKPLCVDRDQAARLAKAAPSSLFVMDKWRYHPGVEKLAEIARGGRYGPVRGVRTTRIGWGNPHRDVDAIWILLPHDISIALEILGHVPRPLAALAETVGSLATGLTATLSDPEGPWVHMEVSAANRRERREVRLVMRDAIAVLGDSYDDRVEVITGDSQTEAVEIETAMPLYRELEAFVRHLGGGPPPRSSAQEALTIVQTICELRALAGLPDSGGIEP